MSKKHTDGPKRIVVITGGSGGIGIEVAKQFVNEGYQTVLIGRNRSKLKKTKAELGSLGDFYQSRVEDARVFKQTIKKIVKKYKSIDCLVNAAGVLGPVGEFHKNNLRAWKQTVEINLFGTVNACSAVLPFMLKRKKGKIVNFSGGGAVQPRPNFSSYAVSKAAVVRLTENLAKEYKKDDIQINSIAPGAINTQFLIDTLKAGSEAGRDEYERAKVQKKSGGDNAQLVAKLVYYLCTPSCKLTGKLISAKWDSWQKFNKKTVEKINQNSDYTLRRIDNKYFYEK